MRARRKNHVIWMAALLPVLAGCSQQAHLTRPHIGAATTASPVSAKGAVAAVDPSTPQVDPHIATAPLRFAHAVDLGVLPKTAPNWYVKDKGKVVLHLHNTASHPISLTFIGWPGDAGEVPHETLAAGQAMTIRFVPPCPGVFALMPAGKHPDTIYGVLDVEGPHGAVDDDGDAAKA